MHFLQKLKIQEEGRGGLVRDLARLLLTHGPQYSVGFLQESETTGAANLSSSSSSPFLGLPFCFEFASRSCFLLYIFLLLSCFLLASVLHRSSRLFLLLSYCLLLLAFFLLLSSSLFILFLLMITYTQLLPCLAIVVSLFLSFFSGSSLNFLFLFFLFFFSYQVL